MPGYDKKVFAMRSQFTLYFDGSFWIGVYQVHQRNGTVRAAKQVFGSQPSDAELWEWLLSHGTELIDRAHAAPGTRSPATGKSKHVLNPKRMARLAAKEASSRSSSTAAQAALAHARDEQKKATKAADTRRRAAEAKVRFEQRQAKRRKKRRGH